MSLIEEQAEVFERLQATRTRDGSGGYTESYAVTGIFTGTLSASTANTQILGDARKAPKYFTLNVSKDVTCTYDELLRRAKYPDQVFRVNSRAELETPPSATLDLRQYSLEEVL